jgi:very-short-patch-repair endonuclease
MMDSPVARARELRHAKRWAEQLLWKHLRNRKLAGCKFRRQHPVDRYILDFYCAEKRLAIEADGREHGEPEAMSHDAQRDAELRQHGIRIVRFWNFQLRENLEGCMERIRMEVEEAPHPGPLPAGRGEGV